MKKALVVDLEAKPKNFEEFIKSIESYLSKNKYEYEFILKDKPAIVMINKKKYECNLISITHLMGVSWSLKFKEI